MLLQLPGRGAVPGWTGWRGFGAAAKTRRTLQPQLQASAQDASAYCSDVHTYIGCKGCRLQAVLVVARDWLHHFHIKICTQSHSWHCGPGEPTPLHERNRHNLSPRPRGAAVKRSYTIRLPSVHLPSVLGIAASLPLTVLKAATCAARLPKEAGHLRRS